MPVDAGFGDSLSSSSFGNVNFGFDISSPTEFDLGFKRKRPSPETKKSDDRSVITFVPEVGKNDDPVQMNKHCPNQAGFLDKTSDHSSRGFPKFNSDSEYSSTASVSHSKTLEAMANREGDSTPKKRSKDSSGNTAIDIDAGALISDRKPLQPPADALLKKLVGDIEKSTLKQWTSTFSALESFGSSKIQLLDQILAAALDHEAMLKKQRAELRDSLLKLANTLRTE